MKTNLFKINNYSMNFKISNDEEFLNVSKSSTIACKSIFKIWDLSSLFPILCDEKIWPFTVNGNPVRAIDDIFVFTSLHKLHNADSNHRNFGQK